MITAVNAGATARLVGMSEFEVQEITGGQTPKEFIVIGAGLWTIISGPDGPCRGQAGRTAAPLPEPDLLMDMHTLGRRALASQPFSVLLGAELLILERKLAQIKVPIRHELGQQHGFIHGGVISYAADNAIAFAAGSVLGESVMTSEFKINYVRPAPGDVLIARAAVVHHGRTQAVCRCEVFADRLCAVAQGTVVRLPARSS